LAGAWNPHHATTRCPCPSLEWQRWQTNAMFSGE
jgi:hypothetical protein